MFLHLPEYMAYPAFPLNFTVHIVDIVDIFIFVAKTGIVAH